MEQNFLQLPCMNCQNAWTVLKRAHELRLSNEAFSPADTAEPCRVLADILALVMTVGADEDSDLGAELDDVNKLGQLRVAWIGSASAEAHPFNDLASAWVDAALCFGLQLFMAIPSGSEPDVRHIDLALAAGARIFLSHDPALVVENVQALIAAPWQPSPQSPEFTRHPLLMQPALFMLASEGAKLYPFIAGLPVDSAFEAEREACFQACLHALAEFRAS